VATFGLALLEVIEKDCFKSTLCIDVEDDAIKDALVLRSKFVTFIKSHEISSELDFASDFFDLIISYSDSKPILRCLSEIQHSDNCEILIISENLFTYNPASTKKGLLGRRSRIFLLYQINQVFSNFSIETYYPFPDVYRPEMILSTKSLGNLYFRYWSWRNLEINLFGKILESLFVKIFRSSIFSPQIIIKLTYDNA